MIKILICLLLILSGCSSHYTLIRNPQSDTIKIALVIDEKSSYLVENMNLDKTNIYVCGTNCLDQFYELEKKYVDGFILVGERVISDFSHYDNKNHIPAIEVQEQSKLEALKELYPVYQWKIWEEQEDIGDRDAFYMDEGLDVKMDHPFYQKNHPESICQLHQDTKQLEIDINLAIEELIENQIEKEIVVKWIKE